MTDVHLSEIVALVRQFTGNTWFHVRELVSGLRAAETDQCVQLLSNALRFAGEDRQIRIIHLILNTDPEQAIPYLLKIVQQAPISVACSHPC